MLERSVLDGSRVMPRDEGQKEGKCEILNLERTHHTEWRSDVWAKTGSRGKWFGRVSLVRERYSDSLQFTPL